MTGSVRRLPCPSCATGDRPSALDAHPVRGHACRMVAVLGWVALVVGVLGFVIGLRRSRRNDELERGLIVWMVLAWVGTAALIGVAID